MQVKPEIILGNNALSHLRDWLDTRGAERILLLTGPSQRFVDRILPLLKGLPLDIFAGAKVHVPRDVVVEAKKRMQTAAADTLVSLGGGAATGLGKALRLDTNVDFVAIPTTYSASEMTMIYGITDGRVKETGRDERVVPDLVIYDPELTAQMSLRLTTTSLMNALAHPISALSTRSLSRANDQQAMHAIETIYRALQRLIQSPQDRTACIWALEGASLAGRILSGAELGIHHKLAHLIGGSFKVEHSGLHSVLLPHFVRSLYKSDERLYKRVAAAAGSLDLPADLFDLLHRANAATSLKQLGIPAGEFKHMLTKHPELVTPWVFDPLQGKRPSIRNI